MKAAINVVHKNVATLFAIYVTITCVLIAKSHNTILYVVVKNGIMTKNTKDVIFAEPKIVRVELVKIAKYEFALIATKK